MCHLPYDDLWQWWEKESQRDDLSVQELGELVVQKLVALQKAQESLKGKFIRLEEAVTTQNKLWKSKLKGMEEQFELLVEMQGDTQRLELENECRHLIKAQIKATAAAELKETMDHLFQSFQTVL